ncbi:MAG: hypothetical protein WC464_05075 [Bdellovibrionales bacterium]
MFNGNMPTVSPAVAQAIEEAVLLGGADEVGSIIEQIKDDKDFPDDIRYGLEAMFYFRKYYGNGGELEPNKPEDKKKLFEMEALWGREIIENLDIYAEAAEKQLSHKE